MFGMYSMMPYAGYTAMPAFAYGGGGYGSPYDSFTDNFIAPFLGAFGHGSGPQQGNLYAALASSLNTLGSGQPSLISHLTGPNPFGSPGGGHFGGYSPYGGGYGLGTFGPPNSMALLQLGNVIPTEIGFGHLTQHIFQVSPYATLGNIQPNYPFGYGNIFA